MADRKTMKNTGGVAGFVNEQKLLARLGKHKTGKACLYINRIDDIDRDVLQTLIEQSVAHVRAREQHT